MAFVPADLTKLCGGNGFTLWHYKHATENPATIAGSGYFTGDAVNMLGVRDLIIFNEVDAPTMTLMIVLTNDGTTVDVGTGLTVTEG
jgi:hypothetical protein